MQISSACMRCIIDIEEDRLKPLKNEDLKREYMKKITARLGQVKETDTAPYLVNRFDRLYEEMFDDKIEFGYIKKDFNDFVLEKEEMLKEIIDESEDPLLTSLILARVGNYIDFGAMKEVSKEKFVSMFHNAKASDSDKRTFSKFKQDIKKANSLLILADNCGEIVLDRFFIEELKKEFPNIDITIMVKGGDVMNDATMEDALHAGIDSVAKIVHTGISIAGTDTAHINQEALKVIKNAGPILSKGQANFETFFGSGYNTYYSFLCKCHHFANLFNVEKLTGMFISEEEWKDRLY